MRFPVALLHNKDGGFIVTFPDIPEAISEGDTEPRLWPTPAMRWCRREGDGHRPAILEIEVERTKRGQKVVELPPSLAAKVLLLNELVRQRPSSRASSARRRRK